MRTVIVAAVLLIVGLPISAQSPEKGAKALFLDTQNGKVTLPKVPVTAGQASTSLRTGANTQVPAITGLMYYLELLQPDGQLVRVTSSTVFHSGERVRLHITSNVDGALLILQKQDQGPFERLLPSSSLPASTASVRKGVDTLLPSADGWFKFDERPGEVQLLVMLLAASDSPATVVASQGAATNPLGGPAPSAETLQNLARAQRGSKGLVIETTKSPVDAGEWHVLDSQRDKNIVPGQIVVEIKLQHRPRA